MIVQQNLPKKGIFVSIHNDTILNKKIVFRKKH